MQVDRFEIYRYLGCHTGRPDPMTCTLVEECLEELQAVAELRTLWRRFPLQITGDTVQIGPQSFAAPSLAAHLQGCEAVLLFAATLGTPVDRLLLRYAQTAVSRAVVLQACAAALLECRCDAAAAAIPTAPLFQRPRYSPGYGSFPLASQPQLLALLDAPRQIGLTCTDCAMLTPSKSITAVIGLSREASCHPQKCQLCENIHCPFRKE